MTYDTAIIGAGICGCATAHFQTQGGENAAFQKASQNELQGILEFTTDEIVSSDIIGNRHSSIVDGLSTAVVGEN